jgi:hypothetical protein
MLLGNGELRRCLKPRGRRLIEAITHLAFYAGWPRAMSAMAVAEEVFGADSGRTTGEETDGQMDG